jgi:alanine dehydrogenase
MRIGIPKEVKNHEYRVAATPAGVHELTALGHDVVIERGVGEGSAIPDDAYGAVTLSYVQQLAEKGFAGAVADNPALRAGVRTMGGQLTTAAVGAAHRLPSVTPVEALNLG